MSAKFAVFDIDGTIFRWQLYHELFDESHRLGLVDEEAARPVFAAREAWQERAAEFDDYEMALVSVVEALMDGTSEATLSEAADRILAASGARVYRYTSELLRSLKDQGYTIIAISGSHQQLVERFARRSPLDIVYGRQFVAVDGTLQGGAPAVYGQKAAILQQLVTDHNLSWDDSYAVGDTNSDGDMMELVAHPIAFNPDRRLYDRARAHGWPIVVERKNVIYELRPDGDHHVLV